MKPKRKPRPVARPTKAKRQPKPVTLLAKVEALLSDALAALSLIEASVEKTVRELLASAATSVAKAKELIPATSPAVRHRAVRSRKRPSQRVKSARSAR